MYELRGKRIFVTGHRGMVGSALLRRLEAEGVECVVAGRDALDLRDQSATRDFIRDRHPDVVVVAAAKVGGIQANARYPADFLLDNLLIAVNLVDSARRSGVEKLLFLGSSCIYPRLAPQPIEESSLLTGPLESTNEWYAIAKIAGLKLCEAFRRQHGCDFIACQPTNLYGPHDNFDLETSHVLPALLRRAHEAKLAGALSLTVWGSGTPRREFLHVDDLADACVHLLRHYSAPEPINVGWGEDISIAELAQLVADVVGYRGSIAFDASRPDGTPRKLLDTSRMDALGWRPRIALADGIGDTYRWFLEHSETARR